MKKLLISLLLSVISLGAADFTITITIPDVSASEVLSTVTAWRARQIDENGDPKYATNLALGRSILADALRRILKQQCEFDPTSCPPTVKIHLDTKTTAETNLESELQVVVQEQ